MKLKIDVQFFYFTNCDDFTHHIIQPSFSWYCTLVVKIPWIIIIIIIIIYIFYTYLQVDRLIPCQLGDPFQ